jgi:hypothetical protein
VVKQSDGSSNALVRCSSFVVRDSARGSRHGPPQDLKRGVHGGALIMHALPRHAFDLDECHGMRAVTSSGSSHASLKLFPGPGQHTRPPAPRRLNQDIALEANAVPRKRLVSLADGGGHTTRSLSGTKTTLRWHVQLDVGFLFSVNRWHRAANEGGPKCANAGRRSSLCGLAQGGFTTEQLS